MSASPFFFHKAPSPRNVNFLLIASLLILSPTTLAGSSLSVAPSSPDEPTPSGGPEIDAQRQSQDLEFQALRQARLEVVETGRPIVSGALPQTFGTDPVLNLDSGLGYSSLQTAINAATAGDTLQVVQDLSEGPVTIDRNLFIQGATGQEVIQASQSTGSSGDARGWFLVDTGIALVIRDLIFNGNGFDIHQAFRHRGLGLFERTHFRDIQFEPSGPLYQGSAIVAFGDRVDVLASTFQDIGRVGVLFFGSSVAGAVYGNNQYLGKGGGNFLDYGVEVNAGASVWVVDSLFTDCRGLSMDGSASAGVLATTASGAGTAVVVDGNHLLSNTFGLRAGAAAGDTTLAVASLNRVFGNSFGIAAGSDLPMNAENNWWACNDGPGDAGCDPSDTNDNGSIDTDPWLVLELIAPRSIKPHHHAPLLARLTYNSDGVDTASLGAVPDGIQGTFTPGSLGNAMPSVSFSANDRFRSLFIANEIEGVTQTSVIVDNQTVDRSITVESGIFCDGFESADALAWSNLSP